MALGSRKQHTERMTFPIVLEGYDVDNVDCYVDVLSTYYEHLHTRANRIAAKLHDSQDGQARIPQVSGVGAPPAVSVGMPSDASATIGTEHVFTQAQPMAGVPQPREMSHPVAAYQPPPPPEPVLGYHPVEQVSPTQTHMAHPATTPPAAVQPTPTQPTPAQPMAPQPMAEPGTVQPTVAPPAVEQPVVAAQTFTQPAPIPVVVTYPVAAQPVEVLQAPTQPVEAQPMMIQPAPMQPMAPQPQVTIYQQPVQPAPVAGYQPTVPMQTAPEAQPAVEQVAVSTVVVGAPAMSAAPTAAAEQVFMPAQPIAQPEAVVVIAPPLYSEVVATAPQVQQPDGVTAQPMAGVPQPREMSQPVAAYQPPPPPEPVLGYHPVEQVSTTQTHMAHPATTSPAAVQPTPTQPTPAQPMAPQPQVTIYQQPVQPAPVAGYQTAPPMQTVPEVQPEEDQVAVSAHPMPPPEVAATQWHEVDVPAYEIGQQVSEREMTHPLSSMEESSHVRVSVDEITSRDAQSFEGAGTLDVDLEELVLPSFKAFPEFVKGVPQTAVEMPVEDDRFTGEIAAKKSNPLALIGNIVFYLLLLVLILTALSFASSTNPNKSFFGYRWYWIQTGSMEPELPVGSLAIVNVIEPQYLRVGDDATFLVPSQVGEDQFVTHRIVEILPPDDPSGHISFITKGIANSQNDPEPRPAQLAVGRVDFDIPYIGLAMAILRSNLIAVCVITACLIGVYILLRRRAQ